MDDAVKTIVSLGFNGGAFAVLVVIAFFLMRHLPRWITDHLTTMQSIASVHKEEVVEIRDTFVSELKAERQMCDRHHENLMGKLEKSNENTARAFDKVVESLDRHHNEIVTHLNASRRPPQ